MMMLFLLAAPVAARGGLGKSTYAVNDALAVERWMSTFVPSINLTGFPVDSTSQCVKVRGRRSNSGP
jgi:hypothetical protein